MGKRKKKKISLFRTLIIILLLIIVICVLVLIAKNSFNLDKKDEETNESTVEVNENSENQNEIVSISLNDYDVYFDEDETLGFNFIIANLKFTSSEGALFYDLHNLTTGEKIRLDDCEYYLSKIKSLKYDVSSFDLLSNQFASEAGYLDGNVFIPFLKNYNELSIYNGEVIKFDLTSHKHNITELFYEVQTEDIKTEKYDISVSNSYTENTFITSDTGEEFPVPLALVFELQVKELETKNVHIEDAKFIPEGASADVDFPLLDDHVDSYKIKNIINKNLKVGDKYGLFFQIFEKTNTNGKILIKFSDSDKWIEVKTGE